MPCFLSGIQPTGVLHLGNYLGAIKNWNELQKKYQGIWFIVDLHAITVKQNPEELRQKTFEMARQYLALGLDPQKSLLFIQSTVSEHAELCWILNTFTQMGELERMTQYKDKSKKYPENINIGLFDYPVLQVADILLYDVDVVPVGEDQKQHLELTRTVARRFNEYYKKKVFKLPKALITKKEEGCRIMGLDDPIKKMSKSASSVYNYIALTDRPEKAQEKIMKAVTDSGKEIRYDEKEKPGIANLLTIYSLLTKNSIQELEKIYLKSNYGTFKKDLAKVVGQFLCDYQKKLSKISDQRVKEILNIGTKKAKIIAEKKMKLVKKVVGLGG